MQVLRFGLPAVLAAAAIAFATPALSHSDVEIEVIGGKIVVDPHNEALTDYATGYRLFEGDFGDVSGGPYRTDDPGFLAEDGTFTPGQLLSYRGWGALSFWNGSHWTTSVPGGERVKFEGALGEETFFTTAGVTGDLSGLISDADSSGGIHQHLDFYLQNTFVGQLPAVGAYMVGLQLFSPGLVDSAPFLLAFNSGLSDDAFEHALMVRAVPEPGTWLMLAAGLVLLLFVRRRQSQGQTQGPAALVPQP
jgi:hypothetical protein